MSAEMLLQHFDRIADTPDAIPRLRMFILDLAVRGKLVEQNPEDEPAKELLKRIEVEKKRRSGSSDKKTYTLAGDQIPFAIPPSWQWTQLAQIGVINPRNDVEDSINASFIPMPLIFAEYGKESQHEVKPWDEIKKGFTHFAEGDVGLAKITPCFENGKSTVFRNLTGGLGAGTTELHIVRPFIVVPDYILIFLKSPYFIETGISKMTGTAGQKRVPKDYFSFSPFPLPPLAEQHRIIAKVDELMKLCDELEAVQIKRERRRDRLVTATLHGLNNGESDPEATEKLSFKESARFYFNHLPRLTTRHEHIQQLRQTILNLAIRGKLVPQDPEDEPARKVLERIFWENQNKWNELQHAKTEGKHCKVKSKPSSNSFKGPVKPNVQDLPKLPLAWEWVCWESILAFGHASFRRGPFGSSLTKSIFVSSGYKVYEQYCPINDDCSFARYYITPQKYEELQQFAVKAKDFLISCSGVTLGRITQVPDEYEEGIINQALLRVRIENKLISDLFFKMLFRSPYFQNQIFSKSTGMAIPNVKGVKELKSIPLPLPPIPEQHRIVTKVNELMKLCDELDKQILNTANTRSQFQEAILHAALNDSAQLPVYFS
jgi:type I restriction enzyme, S subunit